MKRKIQFPPVEGATSDGLVAIGGDLEIDTLEIAYRSGIFPWPLSVDFPLAWFSPDPRGILEFTDFHLPRSFKKFLKKSEFKITYNQNFSQVIKNCATVKRKGQHSTWITPEIIKGYERLFLAGQAYSVEVWKEDLLVGGIYGVIMGNFISGESMFSKEREASKVALYHLIEHLLTKKITWIDTQMVTPVVSQFGGKYIPRSQFLSLIHQMDWQLSRESIF
jgi:leucyl/phenylalanyl-tRNA--protein transferase